VYRAVFLSILQYFSVHFPSKISNELELELEPKLEPESEPEIYIMYLGES
jgi:hypothetical protein